jgi:hypothetical protein
MELVMAKSLAGHDKDKIYVVLGEDGSDLILVNGTGRTLANPKRKRRKHVQPIIHFNNEISKEAQQIEKWTDENVRQIIRRYLDCQRQM